MRRNIEKVLKAFDAGKAAQGDTKRTCWTDGKTVYSYRMPIAWRDELGTVVVVPYAAGPSRTTRSQIRACETFAFTPGDALYKIASDKIGRAA